MLKRITFLCVICLLATLLLTACNQAVSHPQNKKIVAVSIVPQHTFVKAVAGDLLDVITMIPPGRSPENYSPSPRQMELLSQASIYFAIGVPSENANIIPKLSTINQSIKLVSLHNAVAKHYPEREFSPGNRDPHIWLSPKRVQVMIDTIADHLSELDPINKSAYTQNAAKFKQQLVDLDQKITRSLKHTKNKSIIVYHPSMGYFADDYGLNMIALEKEGKQATPHDFEKIIDYAKRQKVRVIFYQAEIDSKQSKVLAQEIGGKAVQIAPLAENYIDNLTKTTNIFSENLQ